MITSGETVKVQSIVFSYNRAMQLDATLHSFFLHCMDAYMVNLAVLYKADENRNALQYQKLAKEYPQVSFCQETNFRRDTLNLLVKSRHNRIERLWYRAFSYLINNKYLQVPLPRSILDKLIVRIQKRIATGLQNDPEPTYTLFLVDDNIFVRDFSIDQVVKAMVLNQNAVGFSLRLGRNTTHNYTQGKDQILPPFSSPIDGVVSYNWPGTEDDFYYPFEISSSVYRTKMIVSLIASLRFHHPNNLEYKFDRCKSFFSTSFPLLLCYETSVTFCDPVNRVQELIKNRAGESVAFSISELRDRFDAGERVDVERLTGFIPAGCHQEVQLSFTTNQMIEDKR